MPLQDPSLSPSPVLGGGLPSTSPHPRRAAVMLGGCGLAQRVPQALLGDAKGVRGHVGQGDVG